MAAYPNADVGKKTSPHPDLSPHRMRGTLRLAARLVVITVLLNCLYGNLLPKVHMAPRGFGALAVRLRPRLEHIRDARPLPRLQARLARHSVPGLHAVVEAPRLVPRSASHRRGGAAGRSARCSGRLEKRQARTACSRLAGSALGGVPRERSISANTVESEAVACAVPRSSALPVPDRRATRPVRLFQQENFCPSGRPAGVPIALSVDVATRACGHSAKSPLAGQIPTWPRCPLGTRLSGIALLRRLAKPTS